MMRSQRLTGVLILSLVLMASSVWADVPGNRNGGRRPDLIPKPVEVESVKVINSVSYGEQPQLDGEAENVLAKIVIPRKVLLQLLNQQNVAPGAAPAAAPRRSEAPIGGTIIAGLCLAAAMVAAGIAWKRTANRRTIAGAAMLLAFLGVSASGFADLGPPLPRPAKPSRVIENHPKANFKVVLEMIEEDGPVQVRIKR